MMMQVDEIRDYCIALPEVEETLPFGPDTLVFKVQGKIFLLLSLDADPVQFNVKCDPVLAEELRENYSCVIPGYHMNKKHWNTIIVDGSVKNALLKEWIQHSYHLVHKKSKK
jgi:predicted DNA-binding protein (MmcQ/YjbR family)